MSSNLHVIVGKLWPTLSYHLEAIVEDSDNGTKSPNKSDALHSLFEQKSLLHLLYLVANI